MQVLQQPFFDIVTAKGADIRHFLRLLSAIGRLADCDSLAIR